MRFLKSLNGIFMLLFVAALGIALIWLPGWLVTQYERVNALGSIWGKVYLFFVGSGVLLVVGSLTWTLWRLWGRQVAKRLQRKRQARSPSQLSPDQMSQEIDENLQAVDQLQETAGNEFAGKLGPLVQQMEYKREQQTLEIVAFGTISSGKSSVLNLLAGRDVFATELRGGTTIARNEIPWAGMDKAILVDTPGLGEIDGANHASVAADAARDSDIVLLVVDGPLRASEFDLLKRLGDMEKKVLICLNKRDWYSDTDRQKLLGQIQNQTSGIVNPRDILAIQAQSGFRKRMTVLADGRQSVEEVDVPPDIESLALRLNNVIDHEGKRLVMSNLLLQSRGLVEKARAQVQESLDMQAWQIVDRHMWGAGGVAAIAPMFIDVAAGVAINTRMILELASVYQQKVDLDAASQWLREMGKNLVGILGMHAAAPVVAAITGSLLKTVPFAGQLAGGVLQGSVQALITRWIGAVFIEYFRNEMKTPAGGLTGLARRQWEELTSPAELRKLLLMAKRKFGGERPGE